MESLNFFAYTIFAYSKANVISYNVFFLFRQKTNASALSFIERREPTYVTREQTRSNITID